MTDLGDYSNDELNAMLNVVHKRQEDALEELTVTFVACSIVADQVLDEMNRRNKD